MRHRKRDRIDYSTVLKEKLKDLARKMEKERTKESEIFPSKSKDI